MASLPGYFYSTSKEGLYVHLYDNNTLDWRLENGSPIRLTQQTKYPWEGVVDMTVDPGKPGEFTLFLRVPAWSGRSSIEVNGRAVPGVAAGRYVPVKRTWQAGDRLRLTLDVSPRLTASNPRVRENLGKVAVERGPLVYCMESLDQPEQISVFDWWLQTDSGRTARATSEWRADLLGGVMVVKLKAGAAPGAADRPLYEVFRPGTPAVSRNGEVILVPYYTFANRENSAMQVWIPYM
jgi:hypothetical protein